MSFNLSRQKVALFKGTNPVELINAYMYMYEYGY